MAAGGPPWDPKKWDLEKEVADFSAELQRSHRDSETSKFRGLWDHG